MKWILGNHQIFLKHQKLVRGIRGITSESGDSKHVLFLDLDHMLGGESLRRWLRTLQKKFRLSTFYVMQSSSYGIYNSWHVLCLDKLTLGQVVDVQNHIRWKTRMHMLSGVARNKWVLRFTKKDDGSYSPKLMIHLDSSSSREKSLAHKMFLQKYYGVRKFPSGPYDDNSLLKVEEYSTIERDSEGNLK